MKTPTHSVRSSLALALLGVLACSGSGAGNTDDCADPPPRVLGTPEVIALTTAAEGGSARPEVVAASDLIYVLYLGDVALGSERKFKMQPFTRDLAPAGEARVLVGPSTDYGSPTDIRVASDGSSIYAFYETLAGVPGQEATFLWAAKYALDPSFTRLAWSEAPLAQSQPAAALDEGGEKLDDPAPVIGPDAVYVVTRLQGSLITSAPTLYHVRKLNKDDLSLDGELTLDVSSEADGRSRVASLVYRDGVYLMALATTVSDVGVYEPSDDGAQSDVILVEISADFSSVLGAHVLSNEQGDRENYVTGLEMDGCSFFITYKQAVGAPGPPGSGQQIAWIKGFGADFAELLSVQVRATIWGATGGELRPSIAVAGDDLYSGQSAGASLGSGNAEIYRYPIER